MKILYGVQGTGNGHISRANAMQDAFKAHPDLDVTWLLTGRDREKGCGAIRNFEWRAGLTFITENGKVDTLKTLRKNLKSNFLADVKAVANDLHKYDLLITDFEPVLAHAARKRGMPVVGLGHQYAFRYPIPRRGSNPVVDAIMKWFAPATSSVGLHWHHFDHPILPPIVDLHVSAEGIVPQPNKVIIYLPFENAGYIADLLKPLTDYEFFIYHPDLTDSDEGNLHRRAISRDGFKRDLLGSSKVVTNSGFELISECLQLGKAIMSKPLHGQMEQLSNAAALEKLAYAKVVDSLSTSVIAGWLRSNPKGAEVHYPNVAAALAIWVAGGCKTSEETLARQLWAQTTYL
jgi:uncharacterized protein (TIGR00661 family)